jgi:hypothetical protein
MRGVVEDVLRRRIAEQVSASDDEHDDGGDAGRWMRALDAGVRARGRG